MHLRFAAPLWAVFIGLGTPAAAHPDGAPWDSADPDTMHSCASCHFDHEPIGRSQALMASGLPEYASPGEVYDIVLRFAAGEGAVAGFLLTVSSGEFTSNDGALQFNGGAVRSAKTAPAGDVVEWAFQWRAGAEEDGLVDFHAAASAANDDQSAFGDEIHFRKFIVPMTSVRD
jgi:hypothetical protein